MLISTKGRYSLRVMIDLAEHQADGYIPLRTIAERQDVSEKYLESIVKLLVKTNFLTGLRGKGGGYQLTRTPEQYTIGSILKLTEGSLAPVSCTTQGASACSRSSCCQTLPMWERLDRMINDFFEGITLEDLLHESVAE